MNNTGHSIYDFKTDFLTRLNNILSVKSPSNPYFRIIMVVKMFPLYAIPSGIIFYLLRSVAELLFGAKFLVKLFI